MLSLYLRVLDVFELRRRADRTPSMFDVEDRGGEDWEASTEWTTYTSINSRMDLYRERMSIGSVFWRVLCPSSNTYTLDPREAS